MAGFEAESSPSTASSNSRSGRDGRRGDCHCAVGSQDAAKVGERARGIREGEDRKGAGDAIELAVGDTVETLAAGQR